MIYALLIVTAFLWGGTFIAGKLLAGQVPPLSSSFLRFFIATTGLLLIMMVSRNMPPVPQRHHWVKLLLLGFTGVFAYNILFFIGLEQISAGRAALIIATTPLVITMVSAMVYKEELTMLKGSGIGLSLVGALFVISNGHLNSLFNGGFGQGEFAIIGCVLSWTAYTIFGRSLLDELSPLPTVLYSSAIGTAMLLLPAVWEGLPKLLFEIDIKSWTALSYLGLFGTALGFTWYYRGITAIGASRAGVFINMVPVFGVLLSWLILGETFKTSVIAGGLLVLTGVKLANSSGWKK